MRVLCVMFVVSIRSPVLGLGAEGGACLSGGVPIVKRKWPGLREPFSTLTIPPGGARGSIRKTKGGR